MNFLDMSAIHWDKCFLRRLSAQRLGSRDIEGARHNDCADRGQNRLRSRRKKNLGGESDRHVMRKVHSCRWAWQLHNSRGRTNKVFGIPFSFAYIITLTRSVRRVAVAI